MVSKTTIHNQSEIFKGPLDSCMERNIRLGLGFLGQRGVK